MPTSFSIENLYNDAFLAELHKDFISSSDDIIITAQELETFVVNLFSLKKIYAERQENYLAQQSIYACKKHFIKPFVIFDPPSENQDITAPPHAQKLMDCDIEFSKAVLIWLKNPSQYKDFLEWARFYAASCLKEKKRSPLFLWPHKTANALNAYMLPQRPRDGFNLTQQPLDHTYLHQQTHYCILCHPRQKDSCRTGFGKSQGCPLDQRISEMHSLARKGHFIAALAVICKDNPLVALTGYRICNDCRKACIYQKQEPVDTPSVETAILEEVLRLPYGFEIYSLFTRWNPLNKARPYPLSPSGKTIMVSGLGPAGMMASHLLMNEGHRVIAVDALTIRPLEDNLRQPIRDIYTLFSPLEKRIPQGMGGVAEYGITVRWQKNFLLLARLLLEKRDAFTLRDGFMLGCNMSIDKVFSTGIQHIALCHGAGKPRMTQDNIMALQGTYLASDILMGLHLSNAPHMTPQLPIVVLGGGLTAIDTATEMLAYYIHFVKNIYDQHEKNPLKNSNDPLYKRYIMQGRILSNSLPKDHAGYIQKWGGVHLVYRNALQNSPAMKLNAPEVTFALHEGISIIDNFSLQAVHADNEQRVTTLEGTRSSLWARTLICAFGTELNTLSYKNKTLKPLKDNSCIAYKAHNKSISILGDMNPWFSGSVVKAMASAKHAVQEIRREVATSPILPSSHNWKNRPYLKNVRPLSPSLVELCIGNVDSPFKPGQFYKLQRYTNPFPQNIPLSGITSSDNSITGYLYYPHHKKLFLHPGEPLSLMGPTGNPSPMPNQTSNILLIGAGLGIALLFPLIRQLSSSGHILTFYGLNKNKADNIFAEHIRKEVNTVSWIYGYDIMPSLTPLASQNFSHIYIYAPLPVLAKLKPLFPTAHTSVYVPMNCMMKGVCGRCVQKTDDGVFFACEYQEQLLGKLDLEYMKNSLSDAHDIMHLPLSPYKN